MNREGFIDSIKTVVIEDSIKSVESNLIKPPGRAPEKKLLTLSEWFNKVSSEDRNMIMQIVKESVETSVFGFLCVLDGVRAIEDDEEKGKLDLYYKKGEKQILLNDPNEDYLHDLL